MQAAPIASLGVWIGVDGKRRRSSRTDYAAWSAGFCSERAMSAQAHGSNSSIRLCGWPLQRASNTQAKYSHGLTLLTAQASVSDARMAQCCAAPLLPAKRLFFRVITSGRMDLSMAVLKEWLGTALTLYPCSFVHHPTAYFAILDKKLLFFYASKRLGWQFGHRKQPLPLPMWNQKERHA